VLDGSGELLADDVPLGVVVGAEVLPPEDESEPPEEDVVPLCVPVTGPGPIGCAPVAPFGIFGAL